MQGYPGYRIPKNKTECPAKLATFYVAGPLRAIYKRERSNGRCVPFKSQRHGNADPTNN
jgi:hypothetical protein